VPDWYSHACVSSCRQRSFASTAGTTPPWQLLWRLWAAARHQVMRRHSSSSSLLPAASRA
jgi:hypothetical protein